MEEFVKGDVVVIPFPFSDLSNSKKRPALVIAKPLGDDLILAQITSQRNLNEFSIKLLKSSFKKGSLPIDSFVKINKIFSADKSIIDYKIGQLNQNKIKEIEKNIVDLFTK